MKIRVVLIAMLSVPMFSGYVNATKENNYGEKEWFYGCWQNGYFRDDKDGIKFEEKLKTMMEEFKKEPETKEELKIPPFLSFGLDGWTFHYEYRAGETGSFLTSAPPNGIVTIIQELNNMGISLGEIYINRFILTQKEIDAICDYIENQSELRVVRLHDVGMTGSELEKLYQALSKREANKMQLRLLDISSNDYERYRKDALLRFISKLNIPTMNLQNVKLDGYEGVIQAAYEIIKKDPSRKIIPPTYSLSEGILTLWPYSKEDFEALGELLGRGLWPEVTCLEISGYQTSWLSGFHDKFKAVEVDQLYKNMSMPLGFVLQNTDDKEVLECLKKLEGLPLTEFTLEGSRGDRKDLPQQAPWDNLFSNLSLSILKISNYKEIPDEFFDSLPQATNLTSLSIENCAPVTIDQVKKILVLPNLTLLYLPKPERMSKEEQNAFLILEKELADLLEILEEEQNRELTDFLEELEGINKRKLAGEQVERETPERPLKTRFPLIKFQEPSRK